MTKRITARDFYGEHLEPQFDRIALFRNAPGGEELIRSLSIPEGEPILRDVIDLEHLLEMMRAHPFAHIITGGLLYGFQVMGKSVLRFSRLLLGQCAAPREQVMECLHAMQDQGFIVLLGEDRGEPIVALVLDWVPENNRRYAEQEAKARDSYDEEDLE